MKFFILLGLVLVSSSKLLQVAEVFRHGSRFVTGNFTNGGELLPTGMRQHYNLGRQLREEYILERNFLSETFNHTEIRVISSDVNRTLQSAQSHLLGFYPEGPKLPDLEKQYLLPPYKGVKDYLDDDNALPYGRQVIPIHVKPSDTLKPSCKTENDMGVQDKKIFEEHTNKFEQATINDRIFLCTHLGIDCNTLDDVANYYTTYKSAIFEGKLDPIKEIEETLAFQRFKAFQMLRDDGGPLKSRFIGAPFINDVIGHFRTKIKHPDQALKFIMYSAHDTNIMKYLAILDLISPECLIEQAKNPDPKVQCAHFPDFAANLIFELHEKDAQQYVIKVKYNGKLQRICNGLHECPIDLFEELARRKIANKQEFSEQCGDTYNEEQLEQTSQLHYLAYGQTIIIIILGLIGATKLN